MQEENWKIGEQGGNVQMFRYLDTQACSIEQLELDDSQAKVGREFKLIQKRLNEAKTSNYLQTHLVIPEYF